MSQKYGFCRTAAAVPVVRPGALDLNLSSMVALAKKAARSGVEVVVYPELSLTGYTCGDLFFQLSLLRAAEAGVVSFLEATAGISSLFIFGVPVMVDGALYNCAAVAFRGELLGVVPKSHLPNTREFNELRWFSEAACSHTDKILFAGGEVPFGVDLIFQSRCVPQCVVGIEIGEDLWSPIPPSTWLAQSGATLLCNLGASNELTGRHIYRRGLVTQQAARCMSGYIYAGAGSGESSTDLVFGGHAMICENGRMLTESRKFSRKAEMIIADVDLEFLEFDRGHNKSFAQPNPSRVLARRIVYSGGDSGVKHVNGLIRKLDQMPFVPDEEAERAQRCDEVFNLQSMGLATRLTHSGATRAVVGISGGLDSTLALLVICEAFKKAGLDRNGIHAITLPGFGTTERTLTNSKALCKGLGVTLECIDIRAACQRHLADIGHTGDDYDITYENAQARERTQILMNKANMLGALVIGTGDLSELALGWCTYNADHMSMYGVNSGVPKTMIRHLILWAAEAGVNSATARVLRDIAATPVSPELLPPGKDDTIVQRTEDVIGPYELHDFFLYHFLRRGATRPKIRYLAEIAFDGRFETDVISHWLDVFFRRFFSQQFKRSCLPDGPKVGSISLSPRSDWRMPSDASDAVWRKK